MNLSGTNVVVTGASMGLGEALARALAAKGARVALVARGKEKLEEVAAAIRAKGGDAHAIPGDIGDKEAIHRIAGAATALLGGPVDIVVHGASTLGKLPMPLLLDTECEDLEAVLQANLVGPFRLTKVLAGPMALRGRGLVISISSDASVNAYPRWGAYGVSKAAQDQLSRVLAAELDGTGVRVLAVDPGEMDTKMHADAIPEADPATLQRPADVAARIVELIENAVAAKSGARLSVPSWKAAS